MAMAMVCPGATCRVLVGNVLAAPTWVSPPATLLRLLKELFTEQPADVLQWVHQAAWRLRTEELVGSSSPGSSGHPRNSTWPNHFACRGVNANVPEERLNVDENSQPSTRGSSSEADAAHFRNRPMTVLPNGGVEFSFGLNCDDIAAKSGIGGSANHSQDFSVLPVLSQPVPAETGLQLSRSAIPDLHFIRCSDGTHRVDGVSSVPPALQGVPTLSLVPEEQYSTTGYPDDAIRSCKLQTIRKSGEDFGHEPCVDHMGGQQIIRRSGDATGHEPSLDAMVMSPSDVSGLPRFSVVRTTSRTGTAVRNSSDRTSKTSHMESESAAYLERYFGRHDMNRLASSIGPVPSATSSVLTADRIKREGKPNSCILSPISRCRLAWDFMFFCNLLVVMWTTFFELAFVPDAVKEIPTWYLTMSGALAIFFCIDIVLNFFTGYIDHGNVILNRKAIAKNYLCSWFILDLIATASAIVELFTDPLLVESLVPHSLRASRAIQIHRTLKSLKLIRVVNIMRHSGLLNIMLVNFDLKEPYVFGLQIFLLLVALYFLSFFNAVIVVGLQRACADFAPQSTNDFNVALERCFAAIACAFSTLLGMERTVEVGSGEALLANVLFGFERVIIHVIVLAWLLCRAAQTQAQLSSSAALRKGALKYMKNHHVSPSLQYQAFRSIQETDEARHQRDTFQRLYDEFLPPYLKRRICSELWGDELMSLDLVHHLAEHNAAFLGELTQVVREEIIMSRVVLFSAGETSNAAYKILKGEFAVTYHEEKIIVPNYTAGMWAGEKALVNPDLRRLETFVSVAWCELMVVVASDFWRLIQRLELKQKFDNLLKQKLLHGHCGRCGSLGSHFDFECPLTSVAHCVNIRAALPMQSPSSLFDRFLQLLRRKDESDLSRMQSADPPTDLIDFLSENRLLHLHAAMIQHGITRLSDLTLSNIEALRADHHLRITQDQMQLLCSTSIDQSRKKFQKSLSIILARSGDSRNHLIFISHCKAESGTEATLMKEEMVRMIRGDPGSPGQNLSSPVFLDSDDLRTLRDLRRHVENSHNLLLLLTPTVLARPWCLVEIVAATRAGVKIVPVEVQRMNLKFEFPDETFYERILAGKELDQRATELLEKEGITPDEVVSAIRTVFQTIAAPFSPHKSTHIRQAELQDILRICHIRPRESGRNLDDSPSSLPCPR